MVAVNKSHYRKGTCFDTLKKRFFTLEAAEHACKVIDEKQPNKTMRPYRCGNHWHLTSKPDWKAMIG